MGPVEAGIPWILAASIALTSLYRGDARSGLGLILYVLYDLRSSAGLWAHARIAQMSLESKEDVSEYCPVTVHLCRQHIGIEYHLLS